MSENLEINMDVSTENCESIVIKKEVVEFKVDGDVNSSNIKTPEKQSPVVSRYGRAHKPKISEDFLPTDKKVGAILGISPKRNSLPRDTNNTGSTPSKVREKERLIFESLEAKEIKPLQRGRKPKLKLVHSPKKSDSRVNGSTHFNLQKKTEENSTNENVQNCEITTQEIKVEKLDFCVDQNDVKIKMESDDSHKYGNHLNDMNSNISDSKVSPVTKDISCNIGWIPGDLAWARIGGHPFWPCMIAFDLRTGVFIKQKRVGRGLTSIQQSLHVQFFGDNGRHSWISTTCVIRFEGKDQLEKFADKVLSEIKKKDKKFSSAFTIRPSSKARWDYAVREAEEVMPKSNEERIRYFSELFPPVVDKEDEDEKEDKEMHKLEKPIKKRKRLSMDEDDRVLKQVKIEDDENLETEKNERKIETKSPANSQTKTPTTQNKPKKRKIKKTVSDYDIFVEKCFHRVSEEHPDLNKQEIEKFISKIWSEMDDIEKSKYQNKLSVVQESGDDSSEIDDNSSNSTRESSPVPLTSTPSKKDAGLFRGMRVEKVCQICFKSGNTVKCKGPCVGTFHIECAKKPRKIKQEENEVKVEVKRGRKKRIRNIEKIEAKALDDKSESNLETEKSSEHNENRKDIRSDASKQPSDETDESSESNDGGEFRCKDCQENKTPACFVCDSDTEPITKSNYRIRCATGRCGKFYHLECLKAWPQASICHGLSRKQLYTSKSSNGKEPTNQVLTCPQHVCHTCASDDPRNATVRFNHERLVRCVRCPTAYHSGNYCVPAGSEILTGSQIICSKHYVPPPRGNYHINAAWCFICAMVGGSLICCDLCPTSFHAECLRISPPDGGYICEDCDTGRFPLYGEVVWVKLGAYRWWPAQILFPNQIPDNIENLPHSVGEFAVRFFGSHDHYWVNRGRVFLYQEGDTGGQRSAKKTTVDGIFETALEEASIAHQKMKVEISLREAEARPGLKPPLYGRIKSNKPVGNVKVYEADPSSMTPCECDANSANPCGFDTDCLNRILMIECTPEVCPAGNRCGNQCFMKRSYPHVEPFKTESRGWGLRTLENIRKGQFVIEYVGEMIDEVEYRRRIECKHQEKDENYYFLTIDKDRMLDAGPKGNVARFMNHSCQPNCETQKWTVNGDTRVGLFALQDIPMGQELTFNYNLECVGTDKKPCMCGARNCSGYIGMKVTKQNNDDDKKSRQLKQEQLMKRRKKRLSQNSKLTEAMCFKCGEGGELLLCDNKTCPKGYHLSCIKRKTWPQGKWLCPWHFCNTCMKRTSRRCGYCPNSFCKQHSDGNITVSKVLGLVCQKHDKGSNENSSTSGTAGDTDFSSRSGRITNEKESSDEKFVRDKHGKERKQNILEIKTISRAYSARKNINSQVNHKDILSSKINLTKSKALALHRSPENGVRKVGRPVIVNGGTMAKRKQGSPRKSLESPRKSLDSPRKSLDAPKKSFESPRKTYVKKKKSENISETKSHSAILYTPNRVEDRVQEKVFGSVSSNFTTEGCAARSSKRKRHFSEKITAYFTSKSNKNRESSLLLSTDNYIYNKQISPYSFKNVPKKTILQRIDHKPDPCKYPLNVQKTLEMGAVVDKTLKTNSNGITHTKNLGQKELHPTTLLNKDLHKLIQPINQFHCVTEVNKEQNIVDPVGNDSQLCDGGLIEKIEENSELLKEKNEFLISCESGKEIAFDEGAMSSVLHSESNPLQFVEPSEKLSDDGKYQILKNVCPDSLVNIDSGALLLHVGS